MPLFKPSLAEKFTPKKIKLSKLYTFNTGGDKLGGSLIGRASEALKLGGYNEEQIRNILYKDREISVAEMRRVAEIFNRAQIYGFEKTPEFAIKKYLNKERVKAQSIARIRREHILEAGQEDLAPYGTTSLNPKGISPNAPKAGEGSILARQRRGNVASSISGKTSSEPISSLRARKSAGSLSPLSATGGGKKSSPSFRPKF